MGSISNKSYKFDNKKTSINKSNSPFNIHNNIVDMNKINNEVETLDLDDIIDNVIDFFTGNDDELNQNIIDKFIESRGNLRYIAESINLAPSEVVKYLKKIVSKYDKENEYLNISEETINNIKDRLGISTLKGIKYLGQKVMHLGKGIVDDLVQCDVYADSDGLVYYVEHCNRKDRVQNLEKIVKQMSDLKKDFPNLDTAKLDKVIIADSRCPKDIFGHKVLGQANTKEKRIRFFQTSKQELSKYQHVSYHEIAHLYDEGYKISNSEEWQKAVSEDHKWSSKYAEGSSHKFSRHRYSEDFAESVANLKDMGPEKYKQKYPNRYNILKKQFPNLCKEGE